MNGQWLGTYEGSSSGNIVANIDQRPDHYEGVVYLIEHGSDVPSSFVRFRTENKDPKFRLRTQEVYALDRATGWPTSWDQVKEAYGKDVTFAQYADVDAEWSDKFLTFTWVTDTNVKGTCKLPRSQSNNPSELVAHENNWSDFKNYVSGLEISRHMFRGQEKQWRLRTSFHRSGRADLFRFLNEDIPALYKHLSSRTRHLFDLKDADQNGAFFHLIQHHGYPTPLLDWTYSPYVAAFFAYRGISAKAADSATAKEKVRIHVFDQAQWRTDFQQILLLAFPQLYVSIADFPAIENERMIPQQSVSTVTNVDDIESYIRIREGQTKKSYLWAIDLPVNERRQVMRDLRYMGITAGSLFPGLDGMCRELAERNFEI